MFYERHEPSNGTSEVVDIKPARLSLAQEMGATHLIDAREVGNVVARILEITGGAGADFAFEAVGNPALLVMAIAR